MEIVSNNEKETFKFATDFAKKMQKGAVLGIVGDLGAGKTVFAQGLAKGFNIEARVTSPTFVIMKVYDVKNNDKIKKLVHIDAYRVEGSDELTTPTWRGSTCRGIWVHRRARPGAREPADTREDQRRAWLRSGPGIGQG